MFAGWRDDKRGKKIPFLKERDASFVVFLSRKIKKQTI
jgi:hypothetical protein